MLGSDPFSSALKDQIAGGNLCYPIQREREVGRTVTVEIAPQLPTGKTEFAHTVVKLLACDEMKIEGG
jgi:hypothetical protein